MNKKFLSAILFGALMVSSTGTFVSCKDYDDDIKDLQEQIDKLATKEDMEAELAALQSALETAQAEATAAKKAAEEALETATEAEKAAAQAVLDVANAKEEAIKAAQAEVAKVEESLKSTIDSKFEAAKSEFAETIAELAEKVQALTGLTTEMITSLDLQATSVDEYAGKFQMDLNYYQIAESMKWGNKTSYTFGEGMEGAFTVEAGEIYSLPAKLLVSVAPVNAAVPAEILSIVDSEGASINEYINLTAKSFDGKLEKSRSAANGLYEITAELKKEADKDAFGKLVKNTTTGKHTAFAVAATKEGRTVTSTYDVTIDAETEELTEAMWIGKQSTIKSSIEKEAALNAYVNNEVKLDAEKCYPVVMNEAFQIKVSSKADAGLNGENESTSKIMASYVIVDMENPALTTTDKAAIKGLTITGVNVVSKDNKFDVKISGDYAQGVVVPLKVVTIDYTGNINDNTDGTGINQVITVWVKAGGNSEITQSVLYTITPDEYVETPNAYSYEDIKAFTVPAGADLTKTKLSIVDEEDEISFTDASDLSFYEDAAGKTASSDPAKIAYAKFAAEVDLQKLVDDKVYEGVVKFFDEDGAFLSQSTIQIQKVLPTAFPADFTAKTNAIDANGVLTVYPEPENGGENGIFNFTKAFNGLTAGDYFVFSSSDVALVGDGTTANPANAAFNNTNYTINTINPDLINDGKTYGAKVAYNYGDIRSAYKNEKDETVYGHSIDWATKFTIKFGCMTVDSEYKWAQEPVEVYYRENTVIKGKVTKDAEGKVTAFTNVFTAVDPYKKEVDPFDTADKGWATWADALNQGVNAGDAVIKLITNGDRVNEFFTAKYVVVVEGTIEKTAIKLTQTSTEVVLTDDVETKVVLVITDKFGHKHEVEALTFTMKKSH